MYLFTRLRLPACSTLFLVVMSFAVAVVHATTVRQMNFSEVVRDADVIAVGTVSSIDPVWDPEREIPFTDVTFSDTQVLKGETRRQVTLRFLGGPAPNGLTLTISGMPQFQTGQEVVVFSIENSTDASPLVGWWQGVYRLFRNAERGVLTVGDHGGRPVVSVDGGVGERVVRTAAGRAAVEALTLDEFISLIEGEL